MIQRTVAGATREYLVVEYAASKRGQPADRLFVPTDQLDLVTRYVGGEAPTINRLGGSDWQQTKARARKLCAPDRRRADPALQRADGHGGHAFAPDTPWQRELEDAFAYIETPDQLSSIEEVKRDMERPVPMDRLICGDVGYGKTEIAVRAAFKAMQDGKQVAVLVPTTLLVQQHLNTFSDRYAGFPVVVKASRASRPTRRPSSSSTVSPTAASTWSSAPTACSARRCASRISASWSSMRSNASASSTRSSSRRCGRRWTSSRCPPPPIPRTLEMAVTGIREMSTLATPPEERHPILTFVGGYDEKQITAAIRRELLRDGQVFYVHNKVSTIEKAAARLRELIPEARVETAHGKMGEHRLEQVVLDFWERRFDVLVCTTIVETGLDISNANTLIVERADQLGLSQLHQLRGRVGRGRERAYSYFLYPPEKPLTETAIERLQTIASNTDLGAGMAVAMKDLEIRGAGNLLGGEQSGHIEGVGFDLYVRLVGEAVANFRGDAEEPVAELSIELPIDAHLPHTYIPGERLRLEAYKKLAAVTSESELAEVQAELVDRYGAAARAGLESGGRGAVAGARPALGVAEIAVQGNVVRFAPVTLRESQQLRLQRLYPKSLYKDGVRSILVPKPMTARVGGKPLRDLDMLDWAATVMRSVLAEQV
jgi:transcription-repair coupling factor (superfamily II helicase)